MAEPCPELVFLAGPQSGEHAVVLGNEATAGRSTRADIQLSEQTASREQMRFQLTAQGWVMENLSSNGTLVNGKRYRGGKSILLDTGDIIGLGENTRILYIAPGDDPEEAMTRLGLTPGPRQAEPVPGPEPEPGPEQMDSPEPEAEPVESAEDAEAARKSKMRKYAIFGGLYAMIIVVVIILLSGGGDGNGLLGDDTPPALTDADIAEAIQKPLKVNVQKDLIKAEEALAKARAYYNRREKTGYLAWSVKWFKIHQAYKGSLIFDDLQDDAVFTDAKRELIRKVKDQYATAYVFLRQGRWRDAALSYQKLVDMLVPFTSEPFPQTDEQIFENVRAHLNYAYAQMQKEREK